MGKRKAAAIMRREAAALQIGVVIYSMTPVLILLQSGIKYLDASGFEDDGNLGLWAGRLFFAYLLMLLVRAVYPVCGRLSATPAGRSAASAGTASTRRRERGTHAAASCRASACR